MNNSDFSLNKLNARVETDDETHCYTEENCNKIKQVDVDKGTQK